MPKFQVFSDLHLDYNRSAPVITVPDDVDVVLVAGDIKAPVQRSISWLDAEVASQGKPIVFVGGNHEHYGQVLENSLASGRVSRATYPSVRWLENETVVLGCVRFVGCTLWTDYDLYHSVAISMAAAQRGLNDHSEIRSFESIVEGYKRGLFTTEQALSLHRESRAWLEAALAEPWDGKTVVVTHHAPHPLSVARKYTGDALNPAFVSDLSALIERHQPDPWVHGHTHSSFDYVVPGTKTRVTCNPRGYDDENPAFDLNMVVEV
jgi:Icc-related predicted phosphoesterase